MRVNGGRTGLCVNADGIKVLDVVASLQCLRMHDTAAADAIEEVLPATGYQDWTGMIGRWDDVNDAFHTLVGLAESGRDVGLQMAALEHAHLEAPLASPAVHIFAMGSNTAVHIQRAMKVMRGLDLSEQEAVKSKTEGLPPFGFMVWPATVVGSDAMVAPPRGTQKFDYEGECAVYVKKGGRYLEKVDLWGYTAFNDFGVRDSHLGLARQADPGPFSLNTPKNFDTGKSCGPWVVVDEGPDPANLRCVLTVNGEVRQDWNLKDMIYSFNDTLSFLSQSISLRPGDMLASGTGAGVALEGGVKGDGWLKPGDNVEIRLDGAGVLRNAIGPW